MRAGTGRDQHGGEGVGHVHGTQEVDAEHGLPVGRFQVPEREAELARAHAHGEDDVVAAAEVGPHGLGRAANRGVVGDVGHQAERQVVVLLENGPAADGDAPGATARRGPSRPGRGRW